MADVIKIVPHKTDIGFDVCVPLNMKWVDICWDVEHLLEDKFKLEPVATGAGFGYRDISFLPKTTIEAEAAIQACKEHFQARDLLYEVTL